jgi:hypothetical protein
MPSGRHHIMAVEPGRLPFICQVGLSRFLGSPVSQKQRMNVHKAGAEALTGPPSVFQP